MRVAPALVFEPAYCSGLEGANKNTKHMFNQWCDSKEGEPLITKPLFDHSFEAYIDSKMFA